MKTTQTTSQTIWEYKILIMTDPITAASAGISLVKGAADLSRKMYELWKESKDQNVKQQLSEMLDQLTVLKQQAKS